MRNSRKKLFEMFDRVNKTNIINEKIIKATEHYRLVELFDDKYLSEESFVDDNKTKEVLTLLKNNEFNKNITAKDFQESATKSKHPDMLTDYSLSDLSKMKLYKLADYNIGFALKQNKTNEFDEIVVVHNNEPDVKGIGKQLMQSAIDMGGCYLDHFDGFLSSLYQSMGFVEYDRDKFDAKYDPDGKFRSKYGDSDVIYRVHKNCR